MEQELNQQLKAIKIVYTALMLGVLFFALVSIYLNQMIGPFSIEKTQSFVQTLQLVGIIISLPSLIMAIVVSKKRMQNIADMVIVKKIETYRSAMIIRAALIEAPCFIFIVFFLLVGGFEMLIIPGLGLLLFLFFYPTNSRISGEIGEDLSSF
ncbi:MAG: hypothetical protein K9G76_07545 [Bacteroidales bacterium]|nr:hypothetical protein [Bacteroidales bacterium]MCF8405432.1 hypothetical protein [Bacteroidales bacterium]